MSCPLGASTIETRARTTARRSRDSRVASSGPARVAARCIASAFDSLTHTRETDDLAPLPRSRSASASASRALTVNVAAHDYDYDLVIIGAGVGGHGAALHAVECGMKTAIIEGGDIGGTCVNRGCVPPKRSSPPPAAFAT